MRLYDIFKRRDDGRCEPVEPMPLEPMDKPKSGMAKLVAVVGAAVWVWLRSSANGAR